MPKEQFKPFDRVLVRSSGKYGDANYQWKIDIFSNEEPSRLNTGEDKMLYRTMTGLYDQCLPYDGNEHLLRSTETPVDDDEDLKFGDHVKVRDNYLERWVNGIFLSLNPDDHIFYKYYVAIENRDRARVAMCQYCKKAEW